VVALGAEKTYETGAPSKATTYNKYHKLTNSKATYYLTPYPKIQSA
jgi:hypothetical protein